MNRHTERRQHGEIPVHGVRVKGFSRDGEVIKPARAFAGLVEAGEKFSARKPRERAAAQQALQVDDEVEISRAQPADAAQHFRPVLRTRPALALETDHAGQVKIAFEQGCQCGVEPPENFTRGKMPLEQTQDGQRLDDVAERAGFED